MNSFLRFFGLDKTATHNKMLTEASRDRIPDAILEVDAVHQPKPVPESALAAAGASIESGDEVASRATPGIERRSANSWKFDAGEGVAVAGFTSLWTDSQFDPERGFGWIRSKELAYRDRNINNGILGRFIVCLNPEPACLRIALEPGIHRVAILVGDGEFGDHVLRIRSDGIADKLPDLEAAAGEYAILLATAQPVDGLLDLIFTSPVSNWVVNLVQIEPVSDSVAVWPQVIRRKFSEPYSDIL